MTNFHTCRATPVNLWRYYQHSSYQRRTICTQWRFRYAPMYMNLSTCTQAMTCINDPLKLLPQCWMLCSVQELFSITLLSPFNSSLQVTAEKDKSYFWRSVPQAEGCTVSMDPIPPDSVKDILVENIAYTLSSKRLQFDLSWTPPTPYGQLKDYDLIVLDSNDRNRLVSGTSIDSLEPYHRQTLMVNKLS